LTLPGGPGLVLVATKQADSSSRHLVALTILLAPWRAIFILALNPDPIGVHRRVSAVSRLFSSVSIRTTNSQKLVILTRRWLTQRRKDRRDDDLQLVSIRGLCASA
jgi:hypothetical protein